MKKFSFSDGSCWFSACALVVSSVLTASSTIHVFLGSFSAQCDPEMAPPATQSVVPGRLLLLPCRPEIGLYGARS